MHSFRLSLLLVAMTALTLAACKDDDPVAVNTIAVTSVSVTPATGVVVTVGQSLQLSAVVFTNGGTGTIDQGVEWIATPASVVSVNSSNGVITGSSAGTATVTAKSNANPLIASSISVLVNAASAAPNALRTLVVNPTSAAVVSGGTQPVSTIHTTTAGAVVTYANSSSTPTRCAVPATGANPLITTLPAGGTGPCIITIVASGSGTGLTPNSLAGSVSVSVVSQPPALLSLTVVPTTVSLAPGGTQVVTITPNLAPGASVSYASASSNGSVATVTPTGASPVITATGNGTAQITLAATGTVDGIQSNTITVIINVNVSAASVSIASVTACVGGPPCAVVPVTLAGALGQIEATLNIASGNQQIASVSVLMGSPINPKFSVLEER